MSRTIRVLYAWLILLPLFALATGSTCAHPHILRASDRSEIPPSELVRNLESARVVFIGEMHDRPGHHQAQLSIIRALRRSGLPLAIGLEMFRKDSQTALDRWISGSYPVGSFLKAYEDNWSLSLWPSYQGIFNYARSEKIQLVGLNIPREISSRVARNGFASLPEAERQALGNVQCVVSPEYEDYIRQALGGHGGLGQQFLFFCEAQILWDSMMARHLFEFLKANPDYRMVVLAGSAHAWKFGIPRKLLEQMKVSYQVILPEMSGRISREQLTPDFTDYLWLDEGDDGWEF